jgi:trimeric autotransporter adhesin
MSTKTTFKRVALVAVASLGFGVLTSVAPASAAEEAAGTVTAITLTALTANTGAASTAQKVSVGLTTKVTAASGGADTLKITGKLTTFPVGGNVAVTAEASSVAIADTCDTIFASGNLTFSNVAPYGQAICNETGDTATAAVTIASSAAGAGLALFSFTPTVVGTYVMTVWNDSNVTAVSGLGILNDNEVSQTVSFTVTAASGVIGNQFPNSADTTAALTGASLAGVKVSSVGIETVQVSGRTGIQVGFAPQYRLTRNAAAAAIADASGVSNATKFATIAYSVANPAGTAVTVYSAQGGTTASASQGIAGSSTPISLGTNATAAENTVAKTQSIDPTTGWPQKGSLVYFSAATAGTYTITAFHDANLDTLVSVGEATTTSTVVIAADALPSITMTVYGQSVAGTAEDALDGGIGQLVKISMKNGTIPASLGLSEVMTVSGPTGTVIDKLSKRNATNFKLEMVENSTANGGFTAADSTTVLLTQANFDAAGNAYINIANSTTGGGTYSISATISGGTGAGATGSGSHTVLSEVLYVPTVNPDKATSFTNLTGVAGTGRAADAAGGNIDFTIATGKATNVAVGYLVGASATADSYSALVTDTYGLITGIIGGSYDLKKTVGTTATTATDVISFTLPVPALASTVTGVAATLTLVQTKATGGGGNVATTYVYRVTGAAAAANKSYSNVALDANSLSIRAGVASSNKMTVKVVDQFGIAMANIAVNAAIAGRNATTVIPTLLSDANGLVTYTLADTSTSTTSLSDTVTFTPTGATASTVTINYATYLPAAKVTLTTPDSANATLTGIAGQNTSDISSLDGAEAGVVDVKAVLTDANGATLPAGIPVTFSVAGTGVAILSTHVTLYTDATGAATTKVYGWTNGDRVVTATAGAVSASGTVYFRQGDCTAGSACAEARTIAAKAAGNVVTATVTDRFGNPIKGVNVVASRKGTGTFNGTSSLTGVTDKAGEVQFVLTNGTADVTVAFESSTFGASSATKGYKNAGITALTAYTAGTTVLAEEGVGASFDAAGVNSATVLAVSDTATIDQAAAATDAAAEATDAANAATDAANAAAEAADAATAAAQDAADAVAALSTQVSEMVDALKKQITALTNLVIKIQKKVKA